MRDGFNSPLKGLADPRHRLPEVIAMRDPREPKFPGQSRLAHWPPPVRSAEILRKVIRQQHAPEEPVNRAVRRGWRLKRELFSDEES
jgi:hypothetical protein